MGTHDFRAITDHIAGAGCVTNKLKVLDLFSGIGGFSLGLERTGGFETVAFCEIEEFPRKVLKKHWPEVPCYEDVRTLTGQQLAADGIAVDVITGGFPCQDASKANSVWGDRLGLHGERTGLFSEIERLAGELGLPILILENTTGILEWMGDILGRLAEIGYDAEWHCIPAAAIGAPHYRDRVWIVAKPCRQRCQGVGVAGKSQCKSVPTSSWGAFAGRGYKALSVPGWREDEPSFIRVDDGVPKCMDIASLGNAVVPQIPEMIGYAILDAIQEAA